MNHRKNIIRYLVCLVASACLFEVAIDFHAPRCADCFALRGVPFAYFNEGGFAGGGGWIWSDLIADVLLVFATAGLFAWAWKRFAERHSR